MKKARLTRLFYFSASFSRGREVHGHNYTLAVTVDFSTKLDEALLDEKIQRSVISKIHSRDLGADVDFLKKTEITDFNLLNIFSKIISREIKPWKLRGLSLDRDARTRLSVAVE